VPAAKWFQQSALSKMLFATMEMSIDQLEACYTLCAAQHKEGLLFGTFEPVIFRRNWETFIEDGDGTIIGLYADDSLCGLLGGVIVCDSQTGSLMGKTMFYYLRKDVRTRCAAFTLFSGFQRWAFAQGARCMMLGVPLDKFQSQLDRHLLGNGYKAHAVTYKKHL
jgi:hypothetical protein